VVFEIIAFFEVLTLHIGVLNRVHGGIPFDIRWVELLLRKYVVPIVSPCPLWRAEPFGRRRRKIGVTLRSNLCPAMWPHLTCRLLGSPCLNVQDITSTISAEYIFL